MANYYYSGQGSVYESERDASTGVPLGFNAVGNVAELEISIETTKYEHKESESGSRAIDLSIVQEKKGTFRMLVENLSLSNLAMGFWGEETTVTAVTDEELIVIAPAVLTQKVSIGATNISTGVSVCTVDYASGTPTVTYEITEDSAQKNNGTLYDYYADLKYGTLTPVPGAVNNPPVVSEDLYVTYTTASSTLAVEALTQDSLERYVRFEGLNTIAGADDVLVDMYKVQLDPLTGYQLINEEIGQMEISGSLLFDDKQPAGKSFFRQTIVS